MSRNDRVARLRHAGSSGVDRRAAQRILRRPDRPTALSTIASAKHGCDRVRCGRATPARISPCLVDDDVHAQMLMGCAVQLHQMGWVAVDDRDHRRVAQNLIRKSALLNYHRTVCIDSTVHPRAHKISGRNEHEYRQCTAFRASVEIQRYQVPELCWTSVRTEFSGVSQGPRSGRDRQARAEVPAIPDPVSAGSRRSART
jgi:hypothetical protein